VGGGAVGAGAVGGAGLAVLSKYSAVTLLPLLPVIGLVRTRKIGWWLVWAVVPVLMLAGYEWLTAKMYGRGLFSQALMHTHHDRLCPTEWDARGIIGMAFAGGCLLPLLFFGPFVWRWQAWLAGGVVISAAWLGLFWSDSHLRLFFNSQDNDLMAHRDFLILLILLCLGGVQVFLLVAAELWRRRDAGTLILACWIIGGLFSAIVLNFAINARSMLLVVPAAAILLVRRLEMARCRGGWLLCPLVPAAAVSLSLAIADNELAGIGRKAAEEVMAKYKTAERTVWFEGHDTFQYYMEKLGAKPVDVEKTLLQPGDIVVLSEYGIRIPLPAGSVGWVKYFQYIPTSWMNLIGGTAGNAAGFYGANWGPVPFVLGSPPLQTYDVVKVFCQVQYNSRPVNPKEVQAGGVPDFKNLAPAVKDPSGFLAMLEVESIQTQPGSLPKMNGRTTEAIQFYRELLRTNTNNVFAMNDLAWILTSSSNPELRNGEEAVQLASRAVELTDSRYPVMIGTLAAAYAEAGRFSEAVNTACIAQALALLTGQQDVFAINTRLLGFYVSGRTVVDAQMR